jgi:AmmeMemoRadiSam system protein B
VLCCRQRQFTLVPIMVGAISTDSEARYGQLLAPYLSDPSNLFIISSDFCHWGSRFKFTNSEQVS